MRIFKILKYWLGSVEKRGGMSLSTLGADTRFFTDTEEAVLRIDELPNARRVVGYPPVSQALQMIAGDCAKLPARVYQVYTSANGQDRYPRPAHYASKLIDLFGSPNDQDTTFDILFDWFFDVLLWGGGYLWIDRRGAKPKAIYRLLPDRTRPVYYKGKRYFQTFLMGDNSTPVQTFYPNDDILYLQGINIAGLAPSSPIRLYQETFQQAINATDFTSAHFKKGTQAGGLLMAPPGASPTAIDNIEKAIEARTKRENWFKTLVLKDGFRWQSVTSSLKDATTVELDESTARHVARIYNIPPSKLGLRESTSYNSLEQDNRQYIDSGLSTWLIQARSQFHRKLIVPSEQSDYVVDYEIDYLNWADSSNRATVYSILIDKQVMTPEEVRRKYNLPPTKSTPVTPPAS